MIETVKEKKTRSKKVTTEVVGESAQGFTLSVDANDNFEIKDLPTNLDESKTSYVTLAEYEKAKKEYNDLYDSMATKTYKLSFATEQEAKDAGVARKANLKFMLKTLEILDSIEIDANLAFGLVPTMDGLRTAKYDFENKCYNLSSDLIDGFMIFIMKARTKGYEGAKNFTITATAFSKCKLEVNDFNKKMAEAATIVEKYETQ